MGSAFDVYNTVTSASRWLRWLRPTLDVTYWVASAVLVYSAVFYLDSGRVRLYTFVLLGCGYIFYRFTFHHAVVGGAFAFLRAFEALLQAVYRIVYALTIRPLLTVFRLCFALSKFLYKVLCGLENWVFWVLGFWCRITLLPHLLRTAWIQRFWTRIYCQWEEICAQASKWLKTKTERV